MVNQLLRFQGPEAFRQRLILSTLSQKPVKITNIRADPEVDQHPGLSDYEVSFLRLLEKVTNGCRIQISHTGTSVTYYPGVITGGKIEHDCPNSRGIGYFLEALIALAPFSKVAFNITLNGVTNCNRDVSVDTLRTCLLPQMKRHGIEGNLELRIKKRGALPLGGGQIEFECPIVKELKPVIWTEEGKIKKIRGLAYSTRVSPQMANRTMDSARKLLTRYIPDVYIYTDTYKGAESGKSPGYALTLVAESSTGVLLSVECSFEANEFETPEDLGEATAKSLLSEIETGGCMDSACQWLGVLFSALATEDICKIRLGKLTLFTIQLLRDINSFLGVMFQIDQDSDTLMLTCLGSGFVNSNKKLQ